MKKLKFSKYRHTNIKRTVLIIALVFSILLIVVFKFIIDSKREVVCGFTKSELKKDLNLKLSASNPSYFNKGNLFDDDSTWLVALTTKEPLDNDFFQNITADLCVAEKKKNQNQWIEIHVEKNVEFSGRDGIDPVRIFDINGDHKSDLLIQESVGYAGVNVFYNGYVRSSNNFIKIKDFKKISNPRFDYDKDLIIGGMKSAMYWYRQEYKINENNELDEISPLEVDNY